MRSYKKQTLNEIKQSKEDEALHAPEGFVMPCVLHCVERIANRWLLFGVSKEVYFKLSMGLVNELNSIPQLNYFTRQDDPIIENIARKLEYKFAPDLFKPAYQPPPVFKSKEQLNRENYVSIVEKVRSTNLDTFFA